MNWFRKIAIFGLLLTFLTGNIGFAIYTHSCSLSGTQQSFFVQKSDPCETLHKEAADSCCEEDNHEATEESIANDCCSTDAQYVKVASDLSAHHFILKAIISNPIIVAKVDFSIEPIHVERISENENFVHPPPKYQGRKLQSVNQVFII